MQENMEKKGRKLYSRPAKFGVLIAFLICVAIFGGASALALSIVDQSHLSIFDDSGSYEETTRCAQLMTREMRVLEDFFTEKRVFETEDGWKNEKWIDIMDPTRTVTEDDAGNTVYSAAQIREMYLLGMRNDFLDILDQSYNIGEFYTYKEGAADINDTEASDLKNFSEIFRFLYNRGSKLEKILPKSGVKLADYARENPETVSLMNLYQGLADIMDRYSQYDAWKGIDKKESNIQYYIEASNDGRVFTNMQIQTWQEAKDYAAANGALIFAYERENGFMSLDDSLNPLVDKDAPSMRELTEYYERDSLVSENEKVILTLDLELKVHDQMRQEWLYYESIRPYTEVILIAVAVSLLLGIFFFVLLTMQAGRRVEDGEIHLFRFDRIPTEITIGGSIAVGVFAALGICVLASAFFSGVHAYRIFFNPTGILEILLVAAAGTICVAAVLFCYLSIVRRIKAKKLWENSLLRVIFAKVKEVYEERNNCGKLLIVFGGFILVKLVVLVVFGVRISAVGFRISGLGVVLEFLLDLLAGLYLFKISKEKQKLKSGLKRLAAGELEYKVNLEDMTSENREMAEEINRVGEGLEKAVKESMKSERLKADLITNVSHDIKTPLTSIINYVDLLKREDIQNEKARGYIEVLDSKSQRLKQLTEDLVEASKVSSGNITLEYTTLNLKELIQQTNGEFSERFAAKNLELISSFHDEPLLVRADGRRIWRIIENLYVNVAKYAMPGTRVYVNAEREGNQVVFTVKNISEQPLNIEADELTERFIRGDVSRSTEGSGLGLSIARSLTTLQHGTFGIYLDGDLFKVTVSFPFAGERKAAEEPVQESVKESAQDSPVNAEYREIK